MSSVEDDHPKLPEDLVIEVLKRLPVASLLRFSCVCRSWRSAINDPHFVALHFRRFAVDASHSYVACLDWRRRLCSLFPNESLIRPSQSQIEIPFVTPLNRYNFVISCDGLIFILKIMSNGCCETIYLWNLFTRKHKAIRRPHPERQFLSGTPDIVQGFCFDARSNDYKIVRVLHFFDRDYSRFGWTKARVDIYSLNNDCWRSFECEAPHSCGYRRAVFFNGNLHWFACEFKGPWDGGWYASIVSFDVAGEVLDEMALPEEIIDDGGCGFAVSVEVLNGMLAVFNTRVKPVGHQRFHSFCYIWVMREYGVFESWTKLYTFEISGLVRGFGGFTRNGEPLVHIEGGEQVSWNPITREFTNLPSWKECGLIPVEESLVSL